MNFLGGYGSGSDSDGEATIKRSVSPPAPSAAQVARTPATLTAQPSAAPASGSPAAALWSRLPEPVIAVKKVIQFRPSRAALDNDGSDSDGETAERERAAKRRAVAGQAKATAARARGCLDFLPPPRAATFSDDLGSGAALGGGARPGPASTLPTDFFEAAASAAAAARGAAGGAGLGGDDGREYGNESYRAADSSDGEEQEEDADVPQAGAWEYAGAGVPEPAEHSQRREGARATGQQQQQRQQWAPAPAAAGPASTAQNSGNAVFEEALRQEQERAARRAGASASAAAGPTFVEIKARDLRYVDAAKQAASEGARGALGAEYALQMRAAAKPFEGDKMAKRKHQIGTLFYNAKMKELEILEGGAAAMKGKSQTQAKYGW